MKIINDQKKYVSRESKSCAVTKVSFEVMLSKNNVVKNSSKYFKEKYDSNWYVVKPKNGN